MKTTTLKFKTFTTSVLAVVFVYLLSLQITTAAKAVTSPVTSPITNPITSPITGPYIISGNVKYHMLALFTKGPKFKPAAGVTVKASGIFMQTSVTTTTDANGDYILPAGQAGLYQVSVSGGQTTFYAPPLRMVPDTKPSGKSNVNFQGLIFNH